jgi:RimJ/RimL family protein N-acetyltransferase
VNSVLELQALETERLVLRPFVPADLPEAHRILDVELAEADLGGEGAKTLEARSRWLQWTILGYEQQARLHQPPYGERAVALRQTGELIGAAGYVPCLDAYGQIPSLAAGRSGGLTWTELGLFYALAPAHRRQGYAAEAARALVRNAFDRLRLGRLIATTGRDNAGSIGVMRKLGMRIETNPGPQPPWMQVVGVLENPAAPPAQKLTRV